MQKNDEIHGCLSTHQAAALCIAMCGLRLTQKPVKRPVVQVRKGCHMALVVPVRNLTRHQWTHWAAIRRNLLAVHVAHARSGDGLPAPLSRISSAGSLCPTWALPVRSRHASQQNCSAGEVEDNIHW